jgi:hypothetical protein
MDHRPYEDWLLEDKRLSAEQERNLRAHLRTCLECSALVRTNMALRAAPMSEPAQGFTARFQVRLAAERKARWWRNVITWSLVLVVGTGVVLIMATPYLAYFSSPSQVVQALMSNLVYLDLILRAAGVIGTNLLGIPMPPFPSVVWSLVFMLFAGIGFLRILPFRKLRKLFQSAALRSKE